MLIKTALNLSKNIRDLGITGRIMWRKDLKGYSTLRIGGEAEIFIEPSSWEDIEKIIVFAHTNRIPFFVLGGGSKVLFCDELFRGIVIHINNPFFKKIELCEEFIKVDCGLTIGEFLNWTVRNSLGGWEFLAGIPGTLGGAVYLNAGVRDYFGKGGYIQIGDFVEEVRAMDCSGNFLRLKKEDLYFAYRKSNLSDLIVLEVVLRKGEKRSVQEIRGKMTEFLNYRKQTQELRFPSAGCVFKNPPFQKSSGELIEHSGLKGKRIGNIAISQKHANFFINLGEGTAKDFLSLMEYVQRKVKFDHGIWLEPEIKIINDSFWSNGMPVLEKF